MPDNLRIAAGVFTSPKYAIEQEVTDVLNYIRNSWGNTHQVMKVSEIKELAK